MANHGKGDGITPTVSAVGHCRRGWRLADYKMKRNTEKLLDGLLEDTVPPEFHAALMGKTLHSARRRKRVRRFSMTVSAMAVAGIFVFSFWKIREPALPPAQTRQPDLMVVNSHPLQPAQIVTDGEICARNYLQLRPAGKFSTTGSSGLYMEINDGQLLAVQSVGTPVPVHHGSGKGCGQNGRSVQPAFN